MAKSIEEAQRHFKDGLPSLDPVDDMGITDPDLGKTVKVSMWGMRKWSVVCVASVYEHVWLYVEVCVCVCVGGWEGGRVNVENQT